MSELRLGEVMTADPLTAAPSASLAEIAAAMRGRGVGSTVIVEEGRVVGIVTERDALAALAAGAHPVAARAESWMTRSPLTLSPADGITHALEEMLNRSFRHIPIVDGGRLVGLVSLRQLVNAARIRHVDPWAPGTARGLENVTVAETALSFIDGRAGRLVYRGYDAVDLALRRSFEDVWHLLYHGDLPVDDAFARQTVRLRDLPLDRDLLGHLARRGGTFMSMLQSAISGTGAAWGIRPWHEGNPGEAEDEALRIATVLPTLVAAIWRLRAGHAPVDPDPSLGHAANYLWMLEGVRPAADRMLALERYLILTAEHGMNASTFTARVIASTGADVVAAVAGAAGAMSGPLHGGAPSLVLDMLDEIGTPARAAACVAEAIAHGRRVMGFGHRVYRAEDPRARCLRDTAEGLGGERVVLARAVETAALAQLRAAKPGRALYTNVEFYAAVVLERAGIPRELFTPTFSISRAIGWTAHIVEQVRDNRLIRPSADYIGPSDRTLTP